MIGNFNADTILWLALDFVLVLLLCLWLAIVTYPNTDEYTVDKNKKALAKKHEVLPLLVKVWSNLDGGKLHVPRLDLDHLEVRKATKKFVLQYKDDIDFVSRDRVEFLKGYKYNLNANDFQLKDERELETELIKFQMIVTLITGRYRTTIEWIANKEVINLQTSALLVHFQPALLKINSILDDSEENQIILEVNTRKMIEDLMSPLLDGLYKIKLAEEKTADELIKSLKSKVNENYQKGLGRELILSGLKHE